jgi:porin
LALALAFLIVTPALLSQEKTDSTASTEASQTVTSSRAVSELPPAPEVKKDAAPQGPRPVHYDGPLASLGKSLNAAGVAPSITFIEFWLGNPGVGESTGQQQAMSLFAYGLDLDMKKIAKIPGATIHFSDLFVPLVHNTGTYGSDAADVFIGQPGPYIPYQSHLTRFTWEQRLGEDRFRFEIGKSNAGNYFAIPVCNTNFGCQSLLTQYDGGMGESPTPYANFLGRVAFNIDKKSTIQIAEWRSTAEFPWTDGWEWNKKEMFHGARSDSNVYLADYQFKSAMGAKYPGSFEAAYYHNTAEQNRELSTGTGYANAAVNAADIHHGTNGMYAGGRQTFYRFDGGRPGPPRALTAFAQLNQSFDSKNVSGITTDFKTGVIVSGLFKKRPIDSYGFNVWTAHLTNDEQTWLKNEYASTFGKQYTVPPTEVAIGPDANFIFKNVIVSPFLLYTFNANSFMNPNFSSLPTANPNGTIHNGWGTGVTLVILVDKILGLSPAMF